MENNLNETKPLDWQKLLELKTMALNNRKVLLAVEDFKIVNIGWGLIKLGINYKFGDEKIDKLREEEAYLSSHSCAGYHGEKYHLVVLNDFKKFYADGNKVYLGERDHERCGSIEVSTKSTYFDNIKEDVNKLELYLQITNYKIQLKFKAFKYIVPDNDKLKLILKYDGFAKCAIESLKEKASEKQSDGLLKNYFDARSKLLNGKIGEINLDEYGKNSEIIKLALNAIVAKESYGDIIKKYSKLEWFDIDHIKLIKVVNFNTEIIPYVSGNLQKRDIQQAQQEPIYKFIEACKEIDVTSVKGFMTNPDDAQHDPEYIKFEDSIKKFEEEYFSNKISHDVKLSSSEISSEIKTTEKAIDRSEVKETVKHIDDKAVDHGVAEIVSVIGSSMQIQTIEAGESKSGSFEDLFTFELTDYHYAISGNIFGNQLVIPGIECSINANKEESWSDCLISQVKDTNKLLPTAVSFAVGYLEQPIGWGVITTNFVLEAISSNQNNVGFSILNPMVNSAASIIVKAAVLMHKGLKEFSHEHPFQYGLGSALITKAAMTVAKAGVSYVHSAHIPSAYDVLSEYISQKDMSECVGECKEYAPQTEL